MTKGFSASPIELCKSLRLNRGLIYALVKREVMVRYRGSILGLLWALITPVFLLLVYTFVFSEVFKARWGTEGGSKVEFSLVLFVGLIIFNVLSECINNAPTRILSNPNYVKKVVFPLEVLPIVTLLSSLFHALISLSVWFGAYAIFLGIPHGTIVYLPLIILPYCMLVMGLSLALAASGVFLRDLTQFINILTTVAMFMSPIFYPITALPQNYRYLLYLNPLTFVIEQARDVLYWGKPPNFIGLGIFGVVAVIVACLGFSWLQKTRKGFSDVL